MAKTNKTIRSLRGSGVPLARAAIHDQRRTKRSPVMIGLLALGCGTMLVGGAAMAMWTVGQSTAAPLLAATAVTEPKAPIATPAVVANATPEPEPVTVARQDFTAVQVPDAATVNASALISELRELTASPEPDCIEMLTTQAGAIQIVFDVASDDLTEDMLDRLDGLAEALNACDGTRIVVAGHSDSTGTEDLNMALSWQRAERVIAAIAERGHPVTRFEPVGYGARQPIMIDGTADTDASRRVEFLVTVAEEVQNG